MTQSINPKIWGSTLWSSMIYVALGYPKSNPPPQMKQKYDSYYRSLASVLPCESCQENYRKHISQYPPNLEDQTTLLNWLLTIHNETLKVQNRSPIPDIQSFVNKYTSSSSLSSSSLWSPLSIFIFCLVLAIIIYYFYSRNQ